MIDNKEGSFKKWQLFKDDNESDESFDWRKSTYLRTYL